jgi:hypothetical protein
VALVARFVDSISSTRSTRLNLHDGEIWAVQADTRFPLPRAQRARVSTLLTDGASYPATVYDDRTLELHLQLTADTADLAAAQLQALARELDRPSNILEYRLDGAAEPVFFRTQRIGLDAADLPAGRATLLDIAVSVPAAPFAYGLREDLSLVTVSNDPAAGSNGLFFDVTGVKGDVATPLYMKIRDSDVSQLSGRKKSAMSVRRRGTPSSMPLVLQAESLVLGTDASLPGNDALMSGSGSNYVRVSFTTNATNVSRITTSGFPTAAGGIDVRGTYRVFARVRHSVGTDTITLQLRATTTPTSIVNDATTLPAGTEIRWVDLGLLQLPIGADPVTDGPSGVEMGAAGVPLAFYAARTAGTGNLDIDVFVFMPADDKLAFITWQQAGTGATTYIVDGCEREQVYRVVTATGAVVSDASPVELAGLLPYVSPGETNRVCFIQDVGSGSGVAGGDAKTSVTQITPYYWPRYLYVRPPTS